MGLFLEFLVSLLDFIYSKNRNLRIFLYEYEAGSVTMKFEVINMMFRFSLTVVWLNSSPPQVTPSFKNGKF